MVQRKAAVITALVLIHMEMKYEPDMVATAASAAWHTHLIYMFFHANFLHLAINCYALWRCFSPWKYMFAAWLISVAASFLTTEPVIGCSGAVCALWGMTLFQLDRSGWIQAAVFFAVSPFIPSVSWQVHLAGFILGMAYISIERLKNEYRKVTGRK